MWWSDAGQLTIRSLAIVQSIAANPAHKLDAFAIRQLLKIE